MFQTKQHHNSQLQVMILIFTPQKITQWTFTNNFLQKNMILLLFAHTLLREELLKTLLQYLLEKYTLNQNTFKNNS